MALVSLCIRPEVAKNTSTHGESQETDGLEFPRGSLTNPERRTIIWIVNSPSPMEQDTDEAPVSGIPDVWGVNRRLGGLLPNSSGLSVYHGDTGSR